MKKSISLVILAGLIAGFGVTTASAQSEGTFFASGSDSATAVIAKRNGYISDDNLFLSIATNVTVTIHRGRVSAPASAASSSTEVTLPTTATNTIGGIVLTTSDYLIVGSTLCDITTLTPASAVSTVVTVTESPVVELNEPVYVADQADIVQFAGKTTHTDPLPYVFTGFMNAPVAIQVPAGAGATLVSGRYQIKK